MDHGGTSSPGTLKDAFPSKVWMHGPAIVGAGANEAAVLICREDEEGLFRMKQYPSGLERALEGIISPRRTHDPSDSIQGRRKLPACGREGLARRV